MRYPPKEWKLVAILMRDSTYSVLEALTEKSLGWTDLRETTGLTDGGLQKVLRELIRMNVVEEVLVKKDSGFKEKRYLLTSEARRERIYEKAKELRRSLEKLASR